MSHISGPGIVAATASYPTHVLVQLTPCPLPVELTAILELPTGTSPPNMSHTYLPVAMISSSRYEITYITYVRGKHKLHIKVNDLELDGSPFTITVYPDPTKLCHPVRTVEELEEPSSIYVESSNTFFVSESHGDKISIVKEDIRHKFGQDIIAPSYVVGDEDGYFYVTKEHEVLKINSKGDIINNSTDNIRNSSAIHEGLLFTTKCCTYVTVITIESKFWILISTSSKLLAQMAVKIFILGDH